MAKTILVGILAPGEGIEFRNIQPTLEVLQGIVGGSIEGVAPFGYDDTEIGAYCNEEGKLIPLRPNRHFPAIDDIIFGTIVFFHTQPDGDEGSLTVHEQEFLAVQFGRK